MQAVEVGGLVRRSQRIRRALRLATLLATAGAAVVAGGLAVPGSGDEWRALVETGDRLASVGGTARVGTTVVTARTAYLLAFHHAQDAGDMRRVLIVAERLDRLGEEALAAHIRRAARAEAGQVEGGPPPYATPVP